MASFGYFFFAVALATLHTGYTIPDQLLLSNDAPSNLYGTGFSVNWWHATFSNVGDKDSCPCEPMSQADESVRVRRVPMKFETTLKSVPLVLVSVTKLNAGNSKTLNYHSQATEITNEGFVLEFKVFCDTFIDEVEVQWMAIG